MEIRAININTLSEVAKALKELNTTMVYVGGAVISLYIDDPLADELRTTNDIDMTVTLSTYGEWVKLQDRLLQLGFSPDPEGHSICSFLYKGILIDLIPSEDSPIGKSNSWYKPGFQYLQSVAVNDQTIQILSTPYFIATKFEAFHDRGGGDYRSSHDFEDIIYVMDNKLGIVDDILSADPTVKSFIIKEFDEILSGPYAEEILSAHLHPSMVSERYPMMINKIKTIVGN